MLATQSAHGVLISSDRDAIPATELDLCLVVWSGKKETVSIDWRKNVLIFVSVQLSSDDVFFENAPLCLSCKGRPESPTVFSNALSES